MRTTGALAVVVLAAALGAATSTPALAGPKPIVTLSSQGGQLALGQDGSATVSGPVAGAPFDRQYPAILTADDGSLPEPAGTVHRSLHRRLLRAPRRQNRRVVLRRRSRHHVPRLLRGVRQLVHDDGGHAFLVKQVGHLALAGQEADRHEGEQHQEGGEPVAGREGSGSLGQSLGHRRSTPDLVCQ